MSTILSKNWFRLGIINLCIVALYGALMRYKIAFDFPFLEQKNLLHAHSHFAFSGWISHLLYSALAVQLSSFLSSQKQKKYSLLVGFNIFCAFGMLAAFTVQGYKMISILFSTGSIVIAIAYACFFIRDAKYLPASHPSKPWAITGLLLNVLSSGGPFSLAYMMATKNIDQHLYLGSVYYYLHFQYNGWFFFGCMALVAAALPTGFPSLKKYHRIFTITIIPTLFLSLLWAKLPAWLYVITVIAALLQFGAWLALLLKLRAASAQQMFAPSPKWTNVFFYSAAIALSVKLLLQAVSVIPSLNQLVFGIRPVVIAYLHLVLLGVYSLFFIGYLFAKGFVKPSRPAKKAAFIFLASVILNEALLAVQGFAAFVYIPVPGINEMLFAAALLLLGSALMLSYSQRLKSKKD